MIIFDTETTGLLAPQAAPIAQQPRIIEFAAVKLDDETLKEVDRFQFLCNPGVIIPEEVIKIHHITNEMVASLPPLDKFLPDLISFFLGTKKVIAYNLSFDLNVLYYELTRRGFVTKFPWPPLQVCAAERAVPIKGYRLKLGDLHLELTGEEYSDKSHRAMDDVDALTRCVRIMEKKKLL